MNVIQNIIYNIFSIQEKILRFQLSKTIGVKQISKRKRHFKNGCVLDLSTLADAEKEKLELEITNILKENNFDPYKTLDYIKKQGTSVYIIEQAASILNPIGENEGFIGPTKGAKALYLSLATEKIIKFKTDAMFILSKGNINNYYFIYHFYNWFAFKHNIAGLDSESQGLLKKYLYGSDDTKNLQLSEIYKLKDAIQQDKAAIEFVIKLCRNYEGTKQALDKIQNNGRANL